MKLLQITALIFVFTTRAAFAQTDPAEVCVDYKNKYKPNFEQYEYCAAAEQSNDASKRNELLWKAWAAVAAVCGAACAANSIAPAAPVTSALMLSCTAATVGTTAYDAIQTKEFQTIGMSLMGNILAAGAISNHWDNLFGSTTYNGKNTAQPMDVPAEDQIVKSDQAQANENLGKQKTSDKVMACLPFVTATLTTVVKKDSAASSKKEAEGNILAASTLKSPIQATAFNANAAGSAAATEGAAKLAATGAATTGKQSDLSDACSKAPARGDAGLTVQCAVAMDSRLGPGLLNPKFKDDFKTATGIPLGDFFAGARTPAQAIGGAMGQSIGSKATELASNIDSISSKRLPETFLAEGSSTYSPGGGSARRGGGGESNLGEDMNAFMQGLMGKLNPEDEKGGGRMPASTLEFKLARMNQDEALRAREISLFDRVSFRYRKQKPTLSQLRWSVPYNRVSTGQD